MLAAPPTPQRRAVRTDGKSTCHVVDRANAAVDAPVLPLNTRARYGKASARSSRIPFKGFAVLVMGVLLLVSMIVMVLSHSLFASSAQKPSIVTHKDGHGSAVPGPTTTRTPRAPLYHADSIESLQSICKKQAPELESTTWSKHFVRTNQTFFLHAEGDGGSEPYAMLAYPVCVHRGTGLLFAEDADDHVNNALELTWSLPYTRGLTHFYDLHDLFSFSTVANQTAQVRANGSASASPMTRSSPSVRVIPAIAILPFGSFISTHMWHLINDALARFTMASHALSGELWRVPRQAVLTDEEGERWLDRRGDTPQKMQLSAAILNGFSSFVRAGNRTDEGNEGIAASAVPAFVDEPLVVRAHINASLSLVARESPDFIHETVCFCQAALVPVYPYRTAIPPTRSLVTIQERTALSFGAPPYRSLETESVWDIERQRTEHYPPWAQQFWHPTSTTSTTSATVYQPRVLFIHRAKRTIANVGVYVKAMRDLGFRVEEAYLERLPTEQQYYLGRYADVVVGMHGLGIGHALWMNRLPTGCRTVIEFRLWAGNGIPISLEAVLKRSLGFHYVIPEPVDVVFGPSVANPEMARRRIKEMGHGGFTHPGWDDQEAVFNESEVLPMLEGVKAHLAQCLSATVAV